MEKLVSILKLGRKQYLALLIGIGSLIFMPRIYLIKFGLENFRDKYDGILGGLFIISAALLLADFISYCSQLVKGFMQNRLEVARLRKRLYDLTIEEKQILRGYISRNTRTQSFDFYDGAVLDSDSFRR